MKVRIGTRGSDLALWQARHVADALRAAGCEVELAVLKTRGDRIDDVPLQQLEGKAFFTAEIEAALLEGRVDVAVHSHKDLPVEGPPGLEIVAVPERAHPGERLLIERSAYDAAAPFLPVAPGRTVGTSAPRRAEQLATLRPDLSVVSLRGNVPTRVRRLREGRYDAIVLASAGLDRLELDTTGLVDEHLALDRLVPAPAQGALAIQARAADVELVRLVREALHDETAAATVQAERALLVAAGGGCSLPLGCCVRPEAGAWRATTFLGADHPEPGAAPRWAEARGADPAAAVQAAHALLTAGTATGCGPLAGRRIAITGAATDGTRLGSRLTSLGADVHHERVVAFEDLECPQLAERVAALTEGDGVAVTSKEAARRLGALDGLPAGVVLGAVGRATEDELERQGFQVTFVGSGGAAELAQDLPVAAGRRVLFPCAQDALTRLEEVLAMRDVEVERLPLYRTVPLATVELAQDVEARVYMSPSAIAACADHERALGNAAPTRLAQGATTAAALERLGLTFRAPAPQAPGGSEAVVHLFAETPQEALS